MKTIGQNLKTARIRKKLSLSTVEEETKIKKTFIVALENNIWDKLPEFPVVLGFVKSLSAYLGLKEKESVAILKRDYPPKNIGNIKLNPKPDVSREFVWNPKLTFLVGGALVFIIVFVYLAFQYIHFVKPPDLTLFNPREGQILNEGRVEVSGKTDPNALVKVNNQPALVNDDGIFTAEIDLLEGENTVEIKAISRSGKETMVSRKIKVESNP
ncbi:hypothetical protein A3D00_02485 [Candidatus Woesebacteria bacterium RIFCSPHIGHO2_02_FULL_38_9]|uniref:HTH cro/C1-type domain-containing protein n=1 Tax=Candidatus Woesebacteria bacterium RIFCSPHIGHO2_01_FULL_39_28 TaxID=1802496 RepID=A0A1F7YGP9_9BACT|nr:MAG: hypothetical protein A2627_05435 [Candidatus Woesebacteria bacterium RIFCSPHIGHO2_01_FULL_39_28]OGM34640.1 MAG: hypothetical protein A3D00_02485 [Candidatus Woesebacteria bacterium RIFCSPHIGHO2_02_FULL_38_9]OGM58220.1 MAG: hypothetical protein A3A50_04390 [Candidatus Woesebacteria bacterium RIFCSPLOWO2_01_FULL_38_20]